MSDDSKLLINEVKDWTKLNNKYLDDNLLNLKNANNDIEKLELMGKFKLTDTPTKYTNPADESRWKIAKATLQARLTSEKMRWTAIDLSLNNQKRTEPVRNYVPFNIRYGDNPIGISLETTTEKIASQLPKSVNSRIHEIYKYNKQQANILVLDILGKESDEQKNILHLLEYVKRNGATNVGEPGEVTAEILTEIFAKNPYIKTSSTIDEILIDDAMKLNPFIRRDARSLPPDVKKGPPIDFMLQGPDFPEVPAPSIQTDIEELESVNGVITQSIRKKLTPANVDRESVEYMAILEHLNSMYINPPGSSPQPKKQNGMSPYKVKSSPQPKKQNGMSPCKVKSYKFSSKTGYAPFLIPI